MAVSTTTTTPTGWGYDAAYQNWQQAQQAINRPYTAYGGNMLAGFQPMQNQAIQLAGQGQGYGMDAMQQGTSAASRSANYQPAMVNPQSMQAVGMGAAAAIPVTNMQAASAGPASLMQAAQLGRGSIRDVAAKDFLSRDINAYMNPYIGTVVNNALSDLSRQNDIVNNTTNAKAAAAGAFGGSRQAVANTLNNENFLRESGNLSGNLRNQGYNTAAQLIGQDNDRDLQAQGMNQNMDWNVGSLNANNQQAASLANINAANNMNQYNAGLQQTANQQTAAAHNLASQNYANAANNINQYNATNQQNANQFNSDLNLKGQFANQTAGLNAAGIQTSAANALNNMGLDQQQWNSNNANQLWNMGSRQQLQEQAGLQDTYNRWKEQYDYPMTQADRLKAALSGAPLGSMVDKPYYANTAANVIGGALGVTQAASQLPNAISGITAGYNALSGMLPSAASSLPSTIYDSGAMTAADLLNDYQSTTSAAPGIWDTVSNWWRGT